MNGLSVRLGRYMRPITKPHWHVDWLLMAGRLLGGVASALTNDPEMEHKLACLLASSHEYVPRFGSSDDDCPSHLFRGGGMDNAVNAMRTLGLSRVFIGNYRAGRNESHFDNQKYFIEEIYYMSSRDTNVYLLPATSLSSTPNALPIAVFKVPFMKPNMNCEPIAASNGLDR